VGGGFFLAGAGMVLQGGATLWTILRLRAAGVTLMRIPVFAWAQLVNLARPALRGLASHNGGRAADYRPDHGDSHPPVLPRL